MSEELQSLVQIIELYGKVWEDWEKPYGSRQREPKRRADCPGESVYNTV